ncbi:MAG: hypothetical protein L6R28_15190 [Planctomycetes bacterium]|nr:hypothetical protein [Planctomycetota bacterium]
MKLAMIFQIVAYAFAIIGVVVLAPSGPTSTTNIIAYTAFTLCVLFLILSYYLLITIWKEQNFHYRILDLLIAGIGLSLGVSKAIYQYQSPTFYKSRQAIIGLSVVFIHLLVFYSVTSVVMFNHRPLEGIGRPLALSYVVFALVGAWLALASKFFY